jgi:3-deoxy-D-manno-octulosonic-acid transferase
MRHLYSAILYLLLPALLLRMLWRSRQNPDYRRRIAERFGHCPVSTGERPLIWLHAVSVGEVLAAVPLIEDILHRFPDHQVLVTTTTPTGSAQVRARFGERVLHTYAPWDTPSSVRRFLSQMRPRLLLLMETELWPNIIHGCRASGCRVMLVNARLSARSARGYQRFPGLVRPMLESLDVVACQAREDGERFLSLGLPESVLQVTGSIKFDIEYGAESRARAEQLAVQYGSEYRPVLVAASTHPGEEEQILSAFAQLRNAVGDCLLLLVPRHPERCPSLEALCKSAGWRVQYHSRGEPTSQDIDIVLGDTMGELALLQSVATVVLVGGSLVPHGGQNPLEAVAWGVPLICGRHMFNFADISRRLVAAGAMIQVENAELATRLVGLMGDADGRRQMAGAGQRVLRENSGVRERVLEQ